MSAPVWLTLPSWAGRAPRDLIREEGEPGPRPIAPQNVHVLARSRAQLPPGTYALRLSADDYCHAWLDGEWLGQGPAPAGRGRCYYQEYPVEGGRTVTVAVHLYYQGLVNRVWNSGDGRLALWAELAGEDGAPVPWDGGWRYQVCAAYSGEATGYDTQFLEDFDSRLWPEGWERPGFDDSGWGFLVPAPWADHALSP